MSSISAITVVSETALATGARKCLSELPVRVLVDEPSFDNLDEFVSRVDALGADAVILEYGALRDSIETTMSRLRQIPRPPAVIILHTEADGETILRVMRAGAVEFCHNPVERPLRVALEKLLKQKAESTPSRGNGKAFGFLSAKGGCGATTVACHLGVALPALLSDRVLLADLTLSGGTIDFLLKAKSPYSFVQAMQNSHRLDDSYWKALVHNYTPRLDLLTGPAPSVQRQNVNIERLPSVLQFARHIYGAAIVDLGRFLTPLSIASAVELDRVLIVTTLDVLALNHTSKIVESMLDAGFSRDRIGLVVNRVTNQRDIEPHDLKDLLGVGVAGVLPDEPTALNEAYREGKLLNGNSRLHQGILRIGRELFNIQPEQSRKKFLFFGAS